MDTIMDTIIHALNTILRAFDGKPNITRSEYMKLYSTIYNISTNRSTNMSQLYGTIKECITEYARECMLKISFHTNEDMMNHYGILWTNYNYSSKIINTLFNYLNTHWIERSNVLNMYDICMNAWENMFLSINKQIMSYIINIITHERNGDIIKTNYITILTDSIICFSKNMHIYKEYFETPVINATVEYYKYNSNIFISNNSVSDYMKYIMACIEKETTRAHTYLHATTLSPLIKCCETACITDHLQILMNEFIKYLTDNRYDDIELLYVLIMRINNGLDEFANTFEKYIISMGHQALNADMVANLTPSLYVDALVNTHDTYLEITKNRFKNNPKMTGAFKNACIKFMNTNTITITSKNTTISSELIAKYIDGILKKSSKTTHDCDIEKIQDSVINILYFIQDKDVFEKFYIRLFAKRLVLYQSVSEELESRMISQLKQIYGPSCITVLQRMFNDMSLSKDINTKFKSHSRLKNNISNDILILTSGVWPLQAGDDIILPIELINIVEKFTMFYTTTYTGRKLSWLFNISKGELKTNYTMAKDKPVSYTFCATTIQMTILLQYNILTEYTATELSKIIGTTTQNMVLQLDVLVKMKILKLSIENDIPKYSLNMKYSYKKTKVMIDLPIKAEVVKEDINTNKHIEEDRQFSIQACIVRIMKMRNTITHLLLIDETIKQMSIRFQPKISAIKKCIDILIDKEYMKRIEGKKDEYVYVA